MKTFTRSLWKTTIPTFAGSTSLACLLVTPLASLAEIGLDGWTFDGGDDATGQTDLGILLADWGCP